MKLIKGFFLLVLACFLVPPLSLINYVLVAKKDGLKKSIGYFFNTAKNLDVWACVEFRSLWNAILIQKGAYLFGKLGETISSVLGKNALLGTLSKTGYILYKCLNWIDKNHCEKSIMYLTKEDINTFKIKNYAN